ncbi:MAG: hypothetical protein KDE24_11850, partial [Caldilinea sp.]|nr:hypothetical protein [Caldilinea sp.]
MTEHIEPKAVAAPERPGSQIRAALAGFAERVAIPEEIVIVTTALLVGIGTGLGAVLFIWLLQQIGAVTAFVIANVGLIAGTLGTMAVAGVLVGFMIDRWASEAKGHGVPEVMEAIAIRG